MDNKQNDRQCAICGETVNPNQEKTEWLCVHCADSWERELESAW